MHSRKMIRLAFQRHSQLDEESWHSILVSLLRGLAAFIVVVAHLRAAMYPSLRAIADPPLWFKGLAFVSGFAHQAVLVFFVISGWLVGGSLLNRIKQPGAIANYAIDRVTRLWTVLIPTFLLTLLFAAATGTVSTDGLDFSPANQYSAITFAGNLIGLQRVLLPDFGGNFPLWSLANETWYYVLFPVLTVACTTRRAVLRIICLAALFLLCLQLPTAIVAYFMIWLLGVLFSRIRIECGNAARWAWALLALAGASYFRLTGELDAFEISTLGQDLVCSLLYLVLLSSMQFTASPASRLKQPLQRVGKFFAEFSFSLYVLHVPLIGLLHYLSTTQLGLRQLSPAAPLHTALYFGMLVTLMGSAYLSYLLFESNTYRIRKVAKRLFLQRSASQPERRTVSTGH
jgi:peptidoglycan/LPS O-acetylase OafA/YrhL